MPKPTGPSPIDPASGFFSSVTLALFLSHWLARTLVGFAANHLDLTPADLWRDVIASGLFLGLVLADPVGAVLSRATLRRVAIKFAIGFGCGVLIEIALVRPFAGGGLSRFLFLFIAVLLVPVVQGLHRLRLRLEARGSDPASEFAWAALRVMGLPDRTIIILVMMLSFAAFWIVSPSVKVTILCMLTVLAATTLYVLLVEVEDEDPWQGLLPEDAEPTPVTLAARERWAYLVATIFPGAFLLGAAMHVAVLVVLGIFPDLGAQFGDAALRTLGVVAATGLGVVFFGMLAALGFGLAFVLLVGRLAAWTQTTIRDRCLRLIKVMCFRPIDRAT